MSDDDLTAVREFRAALDEPRDGALAGGRWRLARTEAPHRPRPRRTWLLAGAGAALSVAVVIAGAAAVHPTAAPKRPDAMVPGQSAAPASTPAAGDLPVTHGTKAPMHPQVTGQAGGTHAAAVEALTRLAALQTGGPAQVGAGEALYVKTYNLRDGDDGSVHEVWLDPQTGVALRIRRSDGTLRTVDHSLTAQEVAEETARAAGTPPGLDNMNGAYVAAFPAGAGRAHELSASWREWSRQAYPGRDTEGMVWKQLHEVLHYVEPRLDARQRAALLLAMADLPAVTATTASIAGRQYDVVCLARTGQSTDCSLFDPATGRFVGDAYPAADMVVKADTFSFVDTGVQPRPAPGTEPGILETKGATGSATTPKR
ncbi:hypothetical protein Daura_47020 [Dactylosporangium aurantiacum]|uniref:CU044_5270 family protein n=1 Tax=Dactylosporangium aurantiacum TaxID=35754 RepID=A0A9Q9IGV7_9ACTN|nr:hypothetical protein [Dactylosporangium aurantiacum]MDG6105507.1 hypothetical protein [Dactylosporangium aurantiacum]UWZ53960.1 hypothetical protein Daura_47020 [Dactylosporangium aurantiacum]